MPVLKQATLFETDPVTTAARDAVSATFVNNLRLPVHRWVRFSAGFSAEWVQSVIRESASQTTTRVFDPFAGSGTTLLAAEQEGVDCCGVEAHPFVFRMAEESIFQIYRSVELPTRRSPNTTRVNFLSPAISHENLPSAFV